MVRLDDDLKNLKLSGAHDYYEWIGNDEIDKFNFDDEIKKDLMEGFKILGL